MRCEEEKRLINTDSKKYGFTHNTPPATHNAYGFRFWLAWILRFAGCLFLAAGFWTKFLTFLFRRFEGPELSTTWIVAVFGSWFMVVVPFMRKKEQIWKRLNADEEKAVDLWLQGIGIFIGLLIASAIFWSRQLGIGDRSVMHFRPVPYSFDPSWIRAVLATWLVLTLPFLIFLYRKADQIFKSAVIRQSQLGPKFRTVFMERSARLLPHHLSGKLKDIPELLERGHIVHLVLKDGRRVPDVFILNQSEILGVYNRKQPDFQAEDILDLEPAARFPQYEEEKWLRLDGRA